MILIAITLYCNEWRFVRSAQHTIGTITMMESKFDSDRDEHFFPHFTFSKSDGTVVEVESSAGSNPPAFEVGEQVPILYQVNDPHNARIATTFQTHAFSILFGIVGVVFVIFGFIARFLRERHFPA
jgi:hypothetical protein